MPNKLMAGWKKIDRRTVYSTPYMQVWEDTIQLPRGKIIDDFSGVDLPDGVLVVATDTEDNVILFEEYKYAVNETIITFPAGAIDAGESPLEAAARELQEETGYVSSEFEILAKEYPYPSKINHANYIVRAKNAKKTEEQSLEETEHITDIKLIPIRQISSLWDKRQFTTSYMMAAVALAFPDRIRNK